MTDAAACETHLTEAGTLAFRVALSVLRHREDAEDVAQEAVVRSLQRFNSLRDRSRFRSWLVRVAWRLALDRRRNDTRRTARDFHLVSPENGQGTAEHDLIQRERARRLWAAIDDLPPHLRLPLVLGTIQGHSVEEVAALLDLPVGTVKSRSFKARRHLKKALLGAGVVSTAIVAAMVMTWQQLSQPAGMPVIHSPVFHSAVIEEPVPSSVARVPKVNLAAISPVPQAAPAAVGPVAIPTIEIPIVDTRIVRLPTISVPVVGVHNIEIPTVKIVSAGSTETHPEKQR
jgi:RNA polymerase sigma-70 factor (ECF subfamily)